MSMNTWSRIPNSGTLNNTKAAVLYGIAALNQTMNYSGSVAKWLGCSFVKWMRCSVVKWMQCSVVKWMQCSVAKWMRCSVVKWMTESDGKWTGKSRSLEARLVTLWALCNMWKSMGMSVSYIQKTTGLSEELIRWQIYIISHNRLFSQLSEVIIPNV